ncbi:hypothetical protein [Sphingomonas sp. LT1P40]|uniref:hypothetical protein n=1 Tax=Alteristakelama amylovorans TaxID=3096166 RepID=UPI002FCC5996
MRGISHLLAAASLLAMPVVSLPVLASPQVTTADDDDIGSIGADFETAVYRYGDGVAGFKVRDARNSPFTGLQRGDIVIAVEDRYFTRSDTFRDFDTEVSQYYSGAPVNIVYLDASAGYRRMNQTARLAVRPVWQQRWAAAPTRTVPAAPVPTVAARTVARPAAPDWGRINQYLDQLVAADSRGWAINEYARGSIRNARVTTLSTSIYQLNADFSYVGGARGHVRVRVADGKFSCIEFQDTLIGCRGLRTPGQGAAIAALVGLVVVAAVASSSSSSSSGVSGRDGYAPSAGGGDDGGGGSGGNARAREEQDRRDAKAREDAQRKTPRVGGEDGIYGCANPPCWDRPQ